MSVFNDIVNVVKCFFRKIGVFVICKDVFIIFSNRLVVVYIRVIIIYKRFRYESCCLIVCVSNVVNNVFVDLNFVSFFNKGVEFVSDFVLICSCYFVVMCFNN